MRAAAMDPAEEPPSLLWGLDSVFSAFARLYIRDILEMTESTQVPGIYFYNLHPISKVDVLGTVVYKREREDFFCYGVDDGTGVINCLCWKGDLLKEQREPSDSGGRLSAAAQGGFDPIAELTKLRRAQQTRCRLEIGELLRVRGTVKTARQQRELKASTYYKVNDPVMAVQMSWMMEVPQLYRRCYDRRPQLEANTAGCFQLDLTQSSTFGLKPRPIGDRDSAVTLLSKATNTLRDFFKQKSVNRFRPYDVQDLLQPLISSQPVAPADQEPVAGPSAGHRLRQLLKEALQVLQDEGVVYRKVKSQDEVYLVTAKDAELLTAVRDVIREDSQREKYAERGCHVLHILSAVRQRYSLNVSRAALELILKSLECSSDIISTSESHYTAF